MGVSKIAKGSIEIESALYHFINDAVLSGIERNEDNFWNSFEKLIREFAPRVEHLLRVRDDYQSQIDAWHIANRDADHNDQEYLQFLTNIGYIKERPESVQVLTGNVDPEIASVAGPQLVVPVDNARYAINAANARWGSLYDALYGTDVISEDDGAERSGPYNPIRGANVIAYARNLLDEHFPLAKGSHSEATKYEVKNSAAIITIGENQTNLADPEQFVGYQGSPEKPTSIFFRKHGLHIEITFDSSDPIGAVSYTHLTLPKILLV